MQPRERRAKEKAVLRSKILEAARTLFVKDGYEAVTMRQIASKINYTATAIYYHFPDKESLLRELCEKDFLVLTNYFRRLGHIADPIERIRMSGVAYVNFGIENPQQYRLIFMTPRPQTRLGNGDTAQKYPGEDAYDFLLAAVREAISAGRFRPELTDPEEVAQAIWASAHGLVALHLTLGNHQMLNWRPPSGTVKMLGEVIMRGLMRSN